MSIRERIRAGSAALVQTEVRTLPKTGAQVKVRGMMQGERARVMTEGYKGTNPQYTKLHPLVLGLCTSDPETGEQVWNPNDARDVAEINAMHPDDVDDIFNAAMRLSGMLREDKEEGNPESE